MRDKEKKHEGHRIIRFPYCKAENKVERGGTRGHFETHAALHDGRRGSKIKNE